MFENSPTWQRVKPSAQKVVGIHLGYVPELEDDGPAERRSFAVAAVAAVLVHAVLAVLIFPGDLFEPVGPDPERPVYVVRQVRFQQPPPQATQSIPERREKRRRIPVPDRTPDEIEPVREDVVADLALHLGDLAVLDAFGVPDGPPAPRGPQPLAVGGDVVPPVRIYDPSPGYTEDARKGRVQGVVILEAIIDALGNVTDVKVLKGLPLGLTESAVETTRTWRFEPARKSGTPVAVFYNLTVRFSLQ